MTSLPLISHRMFVAAIQEADGPRASQAPVDVVIEYPSERLVVDPAAREDFSIREAGVTPSAGSALGI